MPAATGLLAKRSKHKRYT